jgi:hypothetical protein
MPDQEARGRAVYDHAKDEQRPSGRRRRQVADWGVGEELFDGMPGRRFVRDGELHRRRIPRGGADDGRRTIVIESRDDAPPPRRPQPATEEEAFASRDDALRARREHDAVWGGDEPFAPGGDAPIAAPDENGGDDLIDDLVAGDERADHHVDRRADGAGHDAAGAPGANAPVRGPQGGRRTVKIGGHPGDYRFAIDRPRRPPRTATERLGARPDRVAAWAFALGILLIVIAIMTAG